MQQEADAGEPGFAVAHLTAAARAELGTGRRLVATERLRGGSKKGVYRLAFDDGATVIGYAWHPSQDYWRHAAPQPPGDPADPFAPATGSGLFASCHALLSQLGVRTPQVYLLDRSRSASPADIALVEDVRGGTLESQLDRAAAVPHPALAELRGALRRMHQHRRARIGKAGLPGLAVGRSSEQAVTDRAYTDLAEAAGRVPRIAAAREPLAAALRELAAAVPRRAEHALIHGELGPDHVLLDDRAQPVLIDIEGLMFFDVEWEHVFLELRFGAGYRWLAAGGLDPARLRLYRLALSLSLVAGPLRLLDGDFPDRAGMLSIVEYNTGRVLAALDC
ncbi:MAG TPA: phosphotransferase [Streptosporangiaceae bacterium]